MKPSLVLSRNKLPPHSHYRHYDTNDDIGPFGNAYGWEFPRLAFESAESLLRSRLPTFVEVDFRLPIRAGFEVFCYVSDGPPSHIRVELYGGHTSEMNLRHLGSVKLSTRHRMANELLPSHNQLTQLFKALDFQGGAVAFSRMFASPGSDTSPPERGWSANPAQTLMAQAAHAVLPEGFRGMGTRYAAAVYERPTTELDLVETSVGEVVMGSTSKGKRKALVHIDLHRQSDNDRVAQGKLLFVEL